MICPKCGLPEELCACEDMSKGGQRIKVRIDWRKYGKAVTVVEGFDNANLQNVAKDLKHQLACGGTVKGKKVELQGDHKQKIVSVLADMGFSREMIDI
ncbi:MAG: stress response translation initiation inhibitor YciH [Candidatus Altiarchaeales archaeon HGW-Altiarchaeales-3]|nr:MAG: stress response translation initiation inhibitor YciH [Candidatus Altiarchaeales archaeon HGW-Altiarchaeales-3]